MRQRIRRIFPAHGKDAQRGLLLDPDQDFREQQRC